MPDFHAPDGAQYVTDEMITTAKQQIDDYMDKVDEYPEDRYSGRGVVMIAGGGKYIPCAYVALNMLRANGCTLPVELWHIGAYEMDEQAKALFDGLHVTFVDAVDVLQDYPARRIGGWELNPYSILHSRFEEVVFLDADNVPLIDVEEMFEWPEYLEKGAVFWPDFGRLPAGRSIWKLLNIEYRDECEFESGQILVNKRKCWYELNLTMCLNEYSDTYYSHVWGDKETYHMAWRYLNREYAMPARGIHRLRATMCQHDFHDNIIFQHRNMDKFRMERTNARIGGFQREDECFSYLEIIRTTWDGVIRQPMPQTRQELEAHGDIAGNVFKYSINGGGGRDLELLPSGLIGKGTMDLERGWYVRQYADGIHLFLSRKGAISADLTQNDAGTWTGRWVGNELFPVQLKKTVQRHADAQTCVKTYPQTMIDTEWMYIRVGFDTSNCKFLAGGVVNGLGANEQAWWVTDIQGVEFLCLAARANAVPICMLQLGRDGVWRGFWNRHERMEVELVKRG